MTLIDNGDGTWTDTDTGDQYDSSTGLISTATPNNTLFDFSNVPAIVAPATLDTTGGTPIVNSSPTLANGATGGAATGGFSDVVSGILGTVENAFTNLAPSLISTGVIQTPAAQQATALQQAQIAQAAANASASAANQRYLILGVIALVIVLVIRSRRKAA